MVSLEQAVAAPMCTCRLADAGARVLKIERPEGDFARHYDQFAHGECSYFVWLNRGKESVVLDLVKADDKALLEALLKRADIFVQNLKPGTVAKLGFPIARLRRDYPRLICCSISGFGEDGPYAARKAYDLLIQAEVGLASITGTTEPSRVGVSVVDVATGMNAYEAILEALIARGRTGEGAELSVSMFDAMADWMAVPLMQQEAGKPPQRVGLTHAAIAPLWRVSDPRRRRRSHRRTERSRMARAGGESLRRRTRLRTDPRFATNLARVAAPRRDRWQGRRRDQSTRRKCADAKARRCRYRLCRRQRRCRSGASSASAPHDNRHAERAGIVSGAGGTPRVHVAPLWSGPGARRAYREGAGGVYGLEFVTAGIAAAISMRRRGVSMAAMTTRDLGKETPTWTSASSVSATWARTWRGG